MLLCSCEVMSDSLWPHGLQHASLACPSISPGVCSNSCPLSWWCHPSISSSVAPFASCPQSFPASQLIPVNELALCIRWPKYWSFNFSLSPSNEYSGLTSFKIDWCDLLAVQGTLKSLLQHHDSKALFLWCSTFFMVQLSHPYLTTGKTIALTIWTFVIKVTLLLFNMLSWFVISFLPGSKHFNFMAAVTICNDFGAQEKKLCHCFNFPPSICHKVMRSDAMILVFWMLNFKPAFSLSSITLIKRLFSSSSISAIRLVSSASLRLLVFLLAILIPACDSCSLAFV